MCPEVMTNRGTKRRADSSDNLPAAAAAAAAAVVDGVGGLASQLPPVKRVCTAAEPLTTAVPPLSPPSTEQRAIGQVLVLGEGDTGQLGLGENVLARKRPALLAPMDRVVQVVAGGMHSVALDAAGRLWSWGCNDEAALGRATDAEGSETVPGEVLLPGAAPDDCVVAVSAGDSHTAALTAAGHVWLWGVFRDSTGVLGLLQEGQREPVPVRLPLPAGAVVRRVASGCDHLVLLTAAGGVLTMGVSEQGQLGRVAQRVAESRGGRRGVAAALLRPAPLQLRGVGDFDAVWTGAYCTYVRAADIVYAFGLNNYHQLGLGAEGDTTPQFFPVRAHALNRVPSGVQQLAGGQHHLVALARDGHVYCLGRGEYGRLGRGAFEEPEAEAVAVPGELAGRRCSGVAAGTACSFALTEADGVFYSWGMGSSKQLGRGEEDEDGHDAERMEGRQLESRRGLQVSSGGQHTVLLVAEAATE